MATNFQRNEILQKIHTRNRKERDGFGAIILLNNKLFEEAESAKSKNLKHTLETERLKKENLELQIKVDSGRTGSGGSGKAVQTLEHKVFKLQEELTELHRKKGENSQKIIDLNNALQEKEKELQAKNYKIQELLKKIDDMNSKTHRIEQDHTNMVKANEILTDEQNALHLAFVSLEEKFRKSQSDNNDLVTRWMELKSKDADKLNAENDKILKERLYKLQSEIADALRESNSSSPELTKQQTIQKQLEEAAKEQKHVSEPVVDVPGPTICYVVTIPSRALQNIEAHDGEVNAVKWSPSGRSFATGGSDRKVKIWEVQAGRCSSKGSLQGSNGAITSVEFDLSEQLLLASSYDFAVRLWSIGDQRLRHTLTGHGNKVLAAKFLSGSGKCVSGSFDRTLKIWDLRRGACEKTIFAGSSCFDLVTCDGLATNIISGHFDRKLRFWDTRSERGANDIQLQGKVTSLDLSPDNMYLLSSTRDDTLQIIDLRMNQIYKTLDADGFKVGSDWSRAVFSPDGHYVLAGSSDGAIFIWNVYKNKVEKILREHNHTVLSCSWDPKGSSLLSSDKCHTVVYWSDF